MRKLIFLSLILLSSSSFAQQQWSGSNDTTGLIQRTGEVETSTLTAKSSSSPSFNLFRNDNNILDGAVIGQINFRGPNHYGGLIVARSVGAWGTSWEQAGTKLEFWTQDKTSNNDLNKRMIINHDGKVGIGTDNPDQGVSPDSNRKLLVNGGITLKSGSKLSYDPNYYVHAYSEFNSAIPEARFLNYGYYGHRWDTRVGTGMVMLGINGNVGIGTTSPDEKLTVKGKIHTEEVRVDLTVPGPDYVFEKYFNGESVVNPNYSMPTLKEVEAFTKANHHLPEIPSAQEMQDNGMELKAMNLKLLQKIEELTLYTIEQQKALEAQKEKNKSLDRRLEKIEALLQTSKN